MFQIMNRLLGNYIRDGRESKDWSKTQAAAATGVSPRYWGRIEAGQVNVDPEFLSLVAQMLGLDCQRILKLSQYSTSWFVDEIYQTDKCRRIHRPKDGEGQP